MMKSAYKHIIYNNTYQDINEPTIGFGKIFESNDDYLYSYHGYIQDGKMTKCGFIIYTFNKINPIIVKYDGEFLDNKYNGKGKITYKNGDIFIGNFKNNMKDGHGILYNSIGGVIIDNQWKDDIIYDKIEFIEYYTGTNIVKTRGHILNSIKVGTWIYNSINNIIDLIEYYKDYNIDDKHIIEILESTINTNKNGYIINQKLCINFDISDDALIKYTHINTILLYKDCTEEYLIKLKSISIPINNNLIYNLQLNNTGHVYKITCSKPDFEKHIIFLPNKKFVIKNNNITSLYQLNNDILMLYYDGEINKYNVQDGSGTIYNNGLPLFKGTFLRGKLISGIKYSITSPQYIIYAGPFCKYVPNGIGVYYNQLGIKIYEGSIKNNTFNGFGISYWGTTGCKYWEGSWKSGMKHGIGYLYDENEILICHCSYENNVMLHII